MLRRGAMLFARYIHERARAESWRYGESTVRPPPERPKIRPALVGCVGLRAIQQRDPGWLAQERCTGCIMVYLGGWAEADVFSSVPLRL